MNLYSTLFCQKYIVMWDFLFFSLKWSKHFLHSWISLSRVSFLFIHLWTSRNYLTIKTLDQNVKTDEASFREAFCKWVGIGKNKTAWHLPVSTEPLTSDCMRGKSDRVFMAKKCTKDCEALLWRHWTRHSYIFTRINSSISPSTD